ncbi:MAG TPA: secondary thiamine-phosphate synthase enzyme [Elusimicrobia bacterium]|nr:secondary thiamine-phosphate synthase enzyme [Elusimicrobiota bacterium]HBT61426.1 secondary thiamine-phosphate synthase enzyme [Elusimicrobiota bacterium]
MRTLTEHIFFETSQRRELINITARVADFVAKSRVQEGFCLVSAMHITAGIWVNDEEPGIKADLMELLERLAPVGDYRHHRTGEDNGDAHLKRTLLGHQATLPVTKGRLDLGPWEQIFYAEFDGRRRKRVVLKIIGE